MGDNKCYKATPITGNIPTNFKRSEKINPWLRAVCPEAHVNTVFGRLIQNDSVYLLQRCGWTDVPEREFRGT